MRSRRMKVTFPGVITLLQVDDDDDDKLICSTLKSLLEAKQLFDESLARDDEEKEGQRKDEAAPEVGSRCPCSCVDADDSATSSEQAGHGAAAAGVSELLAPDLLPFRRGAAGRSPYRRTKPKVSFADCRSPSSELMSGESTSSSTPQQQRVVADGVRGVSRRSCCVVDVSDSSPTTDDVARRTDDASRTGAAPVRRSQSANVVVESKVVVAFVVVAH